MYALFSKRFYNLTLNGKPVTFFWLTARDVAKRHTVPGGCVFDGEICFGKHHELPSANLWLSHMRGGLWEAHWQCFAVRLGLALRENGDLERESGASLEALNCLRPFVTGDTYENGGKDVFVHAFSTHDAVKAAFAAGVHAIKLANGEDSWPELRKLEGNSRPGFGGRMLDDALRLQTQMYYVTLIDSVTTAPEFRGYYLKEETGDDQGESYGPFQTADAAAAEAEAAKAQGRRPVVPNRIA